MPLMTVLPPHQADFGGHQRQIGDGGGQEELAQGLRPAAVARLAQAELHQPGQPMLGDLAQSAVRSERVAPLEGTCFLQPGFLGMEHH